MSIDQGNRLSRSVIPSHYDLNIKTDLQRQTFAGTCEILLEIHEAIPSITVHAGSPLKFSSAVLAPLEANGQITESRKSLNIKIDEATQRAEIAFEGGEITQGPYKLGCKWEGALGANTVGYFCASFVPPGESDDKKEFYTMTQFQPCDARSAFPCFDEPDLKATFSISLISRVGTTSVSNMDVSSTESLGQGGNFPRTQLLDDSFLSDLDSSSFDEDEWEIVKFAKTPKMCTYLAAFANGRFGRVEGGCSSSFDGRHIPMRVYGLPHQVHQAGLALATSERLLPIFERLFDIPYPLPKLDTLAVPGYGSGAMENWGLIIGGHSVYLNDEATAGIAAKKLTVTVASHELAHQWFGNITTMEWWDDLWLNEAFATIVGEVTVIDDIEPSWLCSSSFVAEHLARALQLDAVRSSHAIQTPCPDESKIYQIFDAVSYSKGGSVLKMLSNFVGQDVFLKGVSTYLKRHLYGNARTADLFKGISDEYGKDISKMMENWTTKIGFPLVTVEETETGLKIRQNRFLSTADATPEEDQTIWQIPLEPLVVSNGDKQIKHGVVLTDREDTFDIKDVKNSTYKLNAETCGVYRVLYPAERLVKIGEEAGKENSAFSLNDRMGLVQDATVLASSGYAKTSSALSLLSKMGNEKENLVWQEIGSGLSGLAQTWWEQSQTVRDGIDNFRRALFKPLVTRLGFENSPNDNVSTVELRTLAIRTLAESGDESTLDEYRRRFQTFLDSDDDSKIPGDLRYSIYSQCIQSGSERDFEKVLGVYKNPPSPAHRTAARNALSSTRDPKLVQQILRMMSGADGVPDYDVQSFGGMLKSNPVGARPYWEWFKSNYDDVVSRFRGSFYLASNISKPFSGFSSEDDLKDVKAFFADKDRTEYEQAYSQGVDAINSKIKWLERDAGDVEEWLRKNQYM